MMMVLCPLLEPIAGFQLSYTMVKKYVKVFMDMVCSVLNIVTPNPTFNVVQGENHIIKITIGVHTKCYDGW